MKRIFKIGFSLLLAVSLLLTSFAILASDDDNFFEGFEGGTIPSGWTVLGSGATKTWEITDIDSHSGSHSIMCHYDNIYITQDEWLITPAINLSKYENPHLMFWHRATWVENDNLPNYVLISTNKTKDKNYFDEIRNLTFKPGTLPSNWERVAYNLSEYKNDTVCIAWRYQSTHGEIWYIDDVYVGEYFDDTPPTISNVTITPAIQKIDGYVNISFDAEDDVENGLKNILLNITRPGNSTYETNLSEIEMIPDSHHYYYNKTYSLSGTYHFYIKAVDKFNNTAQTGSFSFIIKSVFNVTVDPSTTIGEGSNFTVHVKDKTSNDPVENATVKFGDEGENTTDANGTVSFTAPEVDKVTQYNITVSKEGYLDYSFRITIIDLQAPPIKNVEAEPTVQVVNKSVNISCIVDDIAVNLVKVRIYGPTGTSVNMPMNKTSGDNKYYYNATYDITGRYNYSIWANDTSGNTNVSENKSFYIVNRSDVSPPNISDVTINPPSQVAGGNINISCIVTDDVAVANVSLNVTFPDDTTLLLSMNSSSDGRYYLNTTYTAAGLYNFTILAEDASGNKNESSIYNFTILYNAPPVINNITITPSFRLKLGPVNISCEVSDDFGVDFVKINITLPDGNHSVKNLSHLVNTTYYYNDNYSKGIYVFYIIASDIYGVTNQSELHTFQVGDENAPNSSLDKLSHYWYKSDHMNIWATATDDLSGVKNMTLYYRYSLNKKNWSEWEKYQTIDSPPWRWSFNTTEGVGYYQIYCIATDLAGNSENKNKSEVEFGFDNIPPIATVNTIEPYFHNEPFEISANVETQDKLSPISEVDLFYRWSTDNSSWSDWKWFGRDSNGNDGWSWYFDVNTMKSGYYQFYAKARDAADNNETNETIGKPEAWCKIEANTIPTVDITRPKKGYLYINDEEKRALPFEKTIVIGKITINAVASDPDGISKVEFWVNNELKFTDTEAPYTYTLDERKFGRCEITVIAYDKYGNQNNATTNIFMIKLRGSSLYSNNELLKLVEEIDDVDSKNVNTEENILSSPHMVSIKHSKLSATPVIKD
ncbi:MAG: choice-of-anchor J domain-containing protein [Thermoplasmata archaeon]|nr:choice-of-anchor J domain-containing protein [Thermoplasmata archaeon]